MINKLLYKFIDNKTIRFIFNILFVLALSACDDGDDSSLGGDENFNRQASCWHSSIIETVISRVNALLSNSAEIVTGGGGAVIAIGFSVWLALKLLKILPSFKEENLGETWTEIGQKLFLCGFCAIAVSSSSNISWTLETFVLPVYNAFLELGGEILSSGSSSSSFDLGLFGTITFSSSDNYCSGSYALSSGNLKDSISSMASCLTCSVSDKLNVGIKIGVLLISEGGLGAKIIGFAISSIFSMAKFGFLFFVIDGLFRLNFAVLLFPLLIMGVPFKYTRKWSKQGFCMFINSSAIMMFIGLLITMVTNALEGIISTYNKAGAFTLSNTEGGGPVLLSLLLLAILVISLPGLAVGLADKFIGGGQGIEFQKQVSGFIVKAAKQLAYSALNSATTGISTKITAQLEKYDKTREVLDNLKQIKNKIDSGVNSLAGYDKNNDDEYI